jgi:hypothetical protein
MIVEYGVNPNCSELVVRLGTSDRDEAISMLAEINILEYFVKDRYGREQISNWDDEANLPSIIETKDIPKKVLKAWSDRDLGIEDKLGKADKILKDYGIDACATSIRLLEKGKKPDENFADFWISKYPYGDDEELAIWYHQHCQIQGFEMLSKIADHFESEVEAHDGGGIETYNSWLNGEVEEDENV